MLLITICARGGSKGIKGKNIRPIAGQPLIAYSIAAAKLFAEKHNGIVALSTDNEEIKRVAAEYGLKSDYTRPAELATDTAGKLPVLKDLLQYEEQKKGSAFQYLLDLDVTAPLRTQADLQTAFDLLRSDAHAHNLFSVNKAHRNPYFNMVEKHENGYYSLVKQSQFVTRQSAPAVYDMNASFYFYRRSFFDLHFNTAITDKSLIYLMPHTCFDLDEPVDFEFMEYLITANKLDFPITES
jgi:CMP-N-acetylneuraminic acid synthetase